MKLFLVLAALAATALPAQTPSTVQPGQPAVVELFQSQGCSSCPPAIANINALAERPGLITLMFAVDYWDQLGWKDTFAKPAFTERQRAYGKGLRREVGTPQVVVNGRRDLVGGDARALDAVIATTPGATVTATLTAEAVTIGAAVGRSSTADVWLVRYDPRVQQVAIARGENRGKTIAHRNVVRELIRLGRWTGKAQSYPLPRVRDPALRSAVLVQAPGGPILAAAS